MMIIIITIIIIVANIMIIMIIIIIGWDLRSREEGRPEKRWEGCLKTLTARDTSLAPFGLGGRGKNFAYMTLKREQMSGMMKGIKVDFSSRSENEKES